MLEFGYGTHRGLKRRINEDTYCADRDLGLYLVADGMGGRCVGMRAAALVRDTAHHCLSVGMSLESAIHAAGEAIRMDPISNRRSFRVGSTAAILKVHGTRFDVACLGNSRIYAYLDRLYAFSGDGATLSGLLQAGVLEAEARQAPAPAAEHPNMQALGVTPDADLAILLQRGQLRDGMKWLLCSDGIADALSLRQLERALRESSTSMQELVDGLILDALAAGGDDNMTAVALRYRDN